MTDPGLAPYLPTLSLLGGAAAVLVAARWFSGWVREEARKENAAALSDALRKERSTLLAELGNEIQAERDETRHAINDAIRAHAENETTRFDALREQIASYHREALNHMEATRRMAAQVADQYQHIRKEMEAVRESLADARARLAKLEEWRKTLEGRNERVLPVR